jgi:transaldolase
VRPPLQRLSELGQSVWIDYLSRDLLRHGELARMVRDDAVVGVTSNPSIFRAAIAGGAAYAEQLGELAGRRADPKEAFLALAARDVTEACDLLRPVWELRSGRDGYVSIEVDPTLAHDAPATIDEAQRLHDLIDRPNLLVKIPATEAGLVAIEEMIARGRSINVTLIFSLARYAEVVERYVAGLERLVAAGGSPRRVASVASFFVSRVDVEADRRLAELGAGDQLKGRLAVANAKLAYARYRRLFSGARWQALAARGARRQRCLWASTSTKDPAERDVRYVEELIGPDTISTMPEATLRAFQDHGRVAPTLERGLAEAERLLERLAAAGLDYDAVTATLEREGIATFQAAFQALLERIERQGREALASSGLAVRDGD